MKKLKLKLDDLEVSSFAADAESGAVHGMDAIETPLFCGASGYASCDHCTLEVGCYQSKWCSGPGCVQTAADGCMTDDNSPC